MSEAPAVAAVQREFDGQVAVIGVSSRDDLGAMEEFVSTYGVSEFPHIADDDTSIWADFGVTSQPAFAFINDDGSVEVSISSFGEDGLTEKANALIAA
ncbi:MAG: redoxin domain-containing protein [Acidimicrobiales bacterium]